MGKDFDKHAAVIRNVIYSQHDSGKLPEKKVATAEANSFLGALNYGIHHTKSPYEARIILNAALYAMRVDELNIYMQVGDEKFNIVSYDKATSLIQYVTGGRFKDFTYSVADVGKMSPTPAEMAEYLIVAVDVFNELKDNSTCVRS